MVYLPNTPQVRPYTVNLSCGLLFCLTKSFSYPSTLNWVICSQLLRCCLVTCIHKVPQPPATTRQSQGSGFVGKL